MLLDKTRCKAVRIGVQNIGDIPLLPKFDRLIFMVCHMGITHLQKQISQLLWLGTGEFHKFKTVGTYWIVLSNFRLFSVVWKRTHWILLFGI